MGRRRKGEPGREKARGRASLVWRLNSKRKKSREKGSIERKGVNRGKN